MVAPTHAAPPHDAAGLLHERVSVRVTLPHVADHAPIDHAVQAPFTAVLVSSKRTAKTECYSRQQVDIFLKHNPIKIDHRYLFV